MIEKEKFKRFARAFKGGLTYAKFGLFDLYSAQNERFGTRIFTHSAESLEDEIEREIDVLWRCFALEDSENLTPDGIELKMKIIEASELEEGLEKS